MHSTATRLPFWRSLFFLLPAAALLAGGCRKDKTKTADAEPKPAYQPHVQTDRYAGEARFRDYDMNSIYIWTIFTDTITVEVKDDSVHLRNSAQDTVYAQASSPYGSHNHFVGFDLRSKVDSGDYFAGSTTFQPSDDFVFTVYANGDSLLCTHGIHNSNSSFSNVNFYGGRLKP